MIVCLYMYLWFEVLFREFWCSDRRVFVTNEGAQFTNWVHFEQIMVKSTQFEQNWVLWYEIGILIGVNGDKSRYSESQNFEVRQVHPRIFEDPPINNIA